MKGWAPVCLPESSKSAMKLIHDWSTYGFAAALVLMGGLGFWSYRGHQSAG